MGGDPKILIVEDEFFVAMDLESTVRDLGATVAAVCYELGTALEVAKSAEIDAAILDVDLSGEVVYPVADILLQRGIPFVFHTGHVSKAELHSRYANAPVCRKPSTSEDLSNAIRKITG